MTKITYNGKTTELADGYIATLPCKDLKMETDVVVEAPEPAEISDSPLPTEVSTEAEMTALLTSGEVGGVYKYVGATGTYENGALYVLEEEATKTLTIINIRYHYYYGVDGYPTDFEPIEDDTVVEGISEFVIIQTDLGLRSYVPENCSAEDLGYDADGYTILKVYNIGENATITITPDD